MIQSFSYTSDLPSRLDMFLLAQLEKDISKDLLPFLSRSSVVKYIDGVLVNGRAEKKGFRLKEGDIVSIDVERISERIKEDINTKESLIAQDGDLDIVEESREWMVIKKPKGIIVHPGVGNWKDTLANVIKGYLQKKGEYEEGIDRAGIVHRLDKGVSGLMIVAKTIRMQKYLKQQFEDHLVVKVYKAKVDYSKNSGISGGNDSFDDALGLFIHNDFKPHDDWIKVEGYIGRSPYNRKQMIFSPSVFDGGKYSLMYIKPLRDNEILINLKTGRMHQIRATLKYLGATIEGDELYGSKVASDTGGINLEEILLGCFVDDKKFKYWPL